MYGKGPPRFPMTPFYPSGFNQRMLADNQSPVPSQNVPVPPPFKLAMQPDLPSVPPDVVDLSIVRATYDSRPPRAYDFFWEDEFLAGNSQTDGYTVADGWILILRQIQIATFLTTTNDNLHNANFLVDQYGFLNEDLATAPRFQLIVDGIPTPFFTPTQGIGGVPLFDLWGADTTIPCFTLVGQGSNVTIKIPGVTDDDTCNVLVHYFGNLLFATGRNILNEVGNPDPEPIRTLLGDILSVTTQVPGAQG